MQRSAGVIIATFALLGSVLCLLMVALMGFAFLMQSSEGSNIPNAKLGLAFSAVFFLLPAIWGISSSIGLFRVKRWARISTMIFGGLLTFLGVVSPLFVLAIPFPPQPNATPAMTSAIKGAIVGFYLLLAAVGVWWLVYFTRPAVKAQFESGAVTRPPSARPLSISIMGWLCIVGCCCVPLNVLLRFPVVLFGVILTGAAAVLTNLAFGAVATILGIGLLRLKSYAPSLMIGYVVFGIANSVVSFSLPGGAERVQRLMQAMPWSIPQAQYQSPFNPMLMSLLAIPVWLVPIYFVLKNKKAFERSLPPAAPPVISEVSS
jgi:hypothetical protein